jgi:GntR family transcriptional regulator/MocR family aminotransferase
VSLHISLVGRKQLSVEIYRQIRDAMVKGVLRQGDRLPPSRELAATLSVSRMTVTLAYERLVAEGLASSRVGDGTFVNRGVGHMSSESRDRRVDGPLRPQPLWRAVPLPTTFAHRAAFDFWTGIPDASLFPNTKWRRLLVRTLRTHMSTDGVYGDPAGLLALREAIARHIGISRGVIASADDVTVTSGTQQALDVIARVLLSRGDRIAVEDPGYGPARRLFETLGARVVAVPVDREGLVVPSIPRNVRAVYVTPSHQYPTGVSMTLDRRQALLAWADRHNAAILEDDYDSEFRFEDRPLEPIRTLDVADRVVYIGSFSKTLLPGLRLGFLIAPRSLRDAVHRAKFLADWHSPIPLQRVLARFIDDGEFARHLRRLNSVYRERHALVRDRLLTDFADHLDLIPSSTGLHVAARARTASVARIEVIAQRALARGVAIQTWSRFAASDRARAGIVLGYGGIRTSDIQRGLSILRECFDSSRETGR